MTDEILDVLGMSVRVMVPAAAVGGQFACFEISVPPGGAVPPHVHTREDEIFILLEGTVSVMGPQGPGVLGTPGDTVRLPKGSAHSFSNETSLPAKLLVTAVPGTGIESFFRDIHSALAGRSPGDPGVFDTASALVEKHGMKFVRL